MAQERGAILVDETPIPKPKKTPRASALELQQVRSLVRLAEKAIAQDKVEEAERLSQDVFPELRIATLHGRMKSRDKDAVMTDFRDRRYDILVSTSVIEVGIDLPNATVMLIEGADRFGLADLYQLRGRVGRSNRRAYAYLLIPSELELTFGQRFESNPIVSARPRAPVNPRGPDT